MKKLPLGIQDFATLIEGNHVYVDKTETIHRMVTEGKYYFLSRPRRFGKSLLVNTLRELYGGNQHLFEGLWIEDRWDWSRTNPVIHIPFASIAYRETGLEAGLKARMEEIAKAYGLELQTQELSTTFRELTTTLAQRYGRVVLLIDEYDKPIIDYLGEDLDQALANQRTMKTFYSVVKDLDASWELVFITGVSKFSKVSIFSDLNNLTDLTLHPAYGTLLGYTRAELITYFSDRITALAAANSLTFDACMDKIQEWYNGYWWLGKERVYNPFGTLSLFSSNRFARYWFTTATPSFLIGALKGQELYEIDQVEVGESTFESFAIGEQMNLISLMFQTGYLTILSEDPETQLFKLGYPNQEVKKAFTEHLMGAFSQTSHSLAAPLVVKISHAFNVQDLDTAMNLTGQMLSQLPYHLHSQTEKFYHAIIHLVYYYLGVFIESEVNTSRGRADAIVQTDTHVYCLEFKLDQSIDAALQQIRDRRYLDRFKESGKELIAVGINFSTELKGLEGWRAEAY
ncbi:AAA family ATPase [Pontibacter sp. G13]|uniref:ATP-binding protein n=1 Tax=Pontibacter sp. G13 TaxID=3074898 RepID=UPI002889B02B|nr:AAA family ATPase [Pontibacter sp. G13]WNJ16974.1 AAA family ATPase [Pontibacter sp. G13]